MKQKSKGTRALQLAVCSLTTVLLLSSMVGTASAAILFQDDTFATIESDAVQIGSNDAGAVNTAVQFGADAVSTENGNITWNIATNRFSVDHAVDITGGLRSDNAVDIGGTNGLTGNSPASSRNMLRKDSAPNTNAACSALGEVIVNTTTNRVEVCTTTGAAGVAVWSAPTTTIPSGASDPVTCSVSDLFYNTTTNQLKVCTATNTFTVAGPQDFENVYNYDADKTLTTSGGNFTVSSGAGNINLTTTTGKETFTSANAAADAIKLNASNAAGGITGTWGTGGLNFSSATGAFSITGAGASTVGTTSGNLNLTTTTSGNIAMVSAGNITFDDATLTSPLKITNTDTALNATFPAGAGIVDALNSFTLTTSGNGASNVGIFDTGNYFTGTDVEAALQELGAVSGANSANNDVLTFSPQYPDYVIFRDGTNNNGTLTQDYDTTGADYASATDPRQQYYGWTTNNASLEDMDVKFRFPLPADFATVGNFTLRYLTGTATAANNKVDATVSNATDLTASAPTACGTSTANTSTTWGTITITAATINAGCTGGTALNANDLVEVDVKLYDITGATTFARAGTASLAYSN